MKKFIPIAVAVDHANDEYTIIPSAFLSTFPNNFGINLCAIKGFNVDLQDDGQIKSVEIVFIPATPEEIERDKDPNNPVDHTWTLRVLNEQGE